MVFNLGFADTGEFNISDYYCVMCLFLALEKEPIALTKLNISASSNSLYIIVSCVCFDLQMYDQGHYRLAAFILEIVMACLCAC